MESKSFFWGMTLHPDKRYAQVADEPFHISKACIEPASLKKVAASGDREAVTSVYLETDHEEFLLCNLGSGCLNVNLDLNFNKGEKICVRAEGGGVIHLTGYLMESPDYDMDDFDEDSSDEEESSDVENKIEEVKSKSAATNGVNKKVSPLDKLLAEKKKEAGKAKNPEDVSAEIKKAEAMKKKLGEGGKKGAAADDDNEDDSSDGAEDDSMLDLEAEEGEEEEDSDDDGEEEEGEEEEEEEDSSDDDGESDAEEVKEPPPKKKASETAKDGKKLNGTQVETKSKEGKKADKISPVKKEAPPTKKEAEVKKDVGAAQATPAKKESAAAPDATPESNKKKKKNKDKKEKTVAKESEVAKTPKANGEKPKDTATPGKTPKRTLKGGLMVEDLKVGNGPEAKPGTMAAVYYVGKLKSNNKQFDACKEGKPFKFRVGSGEVIKGWDVGVAGMKVGGKRRLICPPQLGYGEKGAGTIPPNSTLVFEVELKSVN